MFILVNNPVEVMPLAIKQPCLYKELPTKDTVLKVSQASLQEDEVPRALQEGCKASQALQEESKASRALQEEGEVSQTSQSGGGDSQSGGASGDQDIALQHNQRPLTDDELSCEPVIDNIKRFQEADEVSRALLSGGDFQLGGVFGDHNIASQPN